MMRETVGPESAPAGKEVLMKTFTTALLAAALALSCGPTFADSNKDEPKKDAEPTLAELSLEVKALRTLDDLRLTTDQMKALAKVAKDTAEPARKRNPGKASDEYRKTLTQLRDALAAANDDEKIAELEDAFAALEEKENPDMDDTVEVTAAARKQAPEAFKKLRPSQLASYLGFLADDVVDPLDVLLSTMKDVRGLKNDDWKDRRDDLAEELGILLGGVDEKKAKRVNDAVVALVDKAKGLSDDDFKAKQADLEKEAEKLVGEVGPERVLRNRVERTLAELLSNPRLGAALEARLKESK
jgi:hypothetical protein